MAKILIIDDDPKVCRVLSELTHGMGHEAREAYTPERGMELAKNGSYDLVFLDLQFPEGNGLKVMPELLKVPSEPEVIIITGSGIQGAEVAFKYGAWDYVEKPFLLSEISLPMKRALKYREEKLAKTPPARLKRGNIIGESDAISRCLDEVGRASVTDASVLITGETGTGKELFARAIHENSNRSSNNFIVVDCGALPETLAEGLLFGHEKGAFTGADRRRTGLVEQTGGGTLFLDEIGDLPLNLQKSFLRALQEKKVRPLGADREISIDFRLVAATHRDLGKMVRKSLFREDLLFRLRAMEIQLPPLRERREDIEDITIHVVRRLCSQYRTGIKGISKDFIASLACYEWPGNVRELINVLEHALAAAAQDATMVSKHLPYHYRTAILREKAGANETHPLSEEIPAEDSIGNLTTLAEYRNASEKKYLKSLLERAEGDRVRARTLSGISQSQLYTLLKKHGLSLS